MKTNENIKARRIQAGLTLKDVADRLGVSEATVQRYESGVIATIPYEKLVVLAEILGCHPAALVGWDDSAEFVGKVDKITHAEIELIRAFRNAPDTVQDAIRVLLGIERK